MTVYADFNRAESIRRGIDPAISEQVWNSEGGLTEPARVGKFPTGWSWYAPQLHFGGAEYPQFGTVAGMGNSFAAFTGWAPGDPDAWRDAMRYSLDAVKRGGWGPWHGATAHGITGFRGVDVNFPWNGTPDDEWDWKKKVTKPPPTTDPWGRTQLITDGFSTPAEWPTSNPRPIQAICWHDMEGHLAGAIARWNTGVAGAHLCVLEDGTIVRTCLIENIAWHAGTNNDPSGGLYGRTPFWRTHNINPYSIGVELEGFVATGYTQAQIDACVKIGIWAQAKYGIAPVHTVDQIPGHHLHGELSSSRSDPGPLFPFAEILRRIAEGGIHVSDPSSAYSVGPGILTEMEKHGETPGCDEQFFKQGDRDEWSEAVSTAGVRYIWLPSIGRIFRYPPAA